MHYIHQTPHVRVLIFAKTTPTFPHNMRIGNRKIGKSQPIMFSFCAKTCSNHDRGNMSMTITFVFTLTATSSVKHWNDTSFAPWLVRPHRVRPHELILNFLFRVRQSPSMDERMINKHVFCDFVSSCTVRER